MNRLQIKQLILSGQIKVFNDLFEYTSVKAIAEAMDRSSEHVETVRKNHQKLTLGDLFKLSDWLGIGWKRVAELFAE